MPARATTPSARVVRVAGVRYETVRAYSAARARAAGPRAFSHVGGRLEPRRWSRSPTTVNEREGQRRSRARQAMGESSCASSTTMWPYAHVRSLAARSDSGVQVSCPATCSASIWAVTMPPPRFWASIASRARSIAPASASRDEEEDDGMGPSSSSHSSRIGTSETVHGAERGRTRAASSSGRRGEPALRFAAASTSGRA